MPAYSEVEVGTELPGQDFPLQRATLVRYAGASGDFNIIHWNERIATAVGLPNVIAHGMLTMAEAGRVVTDWIGDPGALLELRVRFSRPIPVPDDDQGAVLHVSGAVEEKLDGNRVVVRLTATIGGGSDGDDPLKVLTGARAVVRLP
jgi:acyl dehydratase